MKTQLPEPGASIASLLASTPDEVDTDLLGVKELTDGETILGPIPDEAHRLIILRSKFTARIREISKETLKLSEDHSALHTAGDVDPTVCVQLLLELNTLSVELHGLTDHHELLSRLMWASIHLHFGLRGATNTGVGLAKGPDGLVVVSLTPEDSVQIGGVTIEVGTTPPAQKTSSGFVSWLRNRFVRTSANTAN
jgi:hypothetical protein